MQKGNVILFYFSKFVAFGPDLRGSGCGRKEYCVYDAAPAPAQFGLFWLQN
jgi:hypothetical protein